MVVAITGASAGIGRTLAEQLHACGAKLALCARRLDRLDELNRSLGGSHFVMQADVASPNDCGMFVLRAFEHFGRIDTLVANAGYGQYKLTHEMTEAATERQPTDPGVADDAAGGSEPELLGGAVELAPEDST